MARVRVKGEGERAESSLFSSRACATRADAHLDGGEEVLVSGGLRFELLMRPVHLLLELPLPRLRQGCRLTHACLPLGAHPRALFEAHPRSRLCGELRPLEVLPGREPLRLQQAQPLFGRLLRGLRHLAQPAQIVLELVVLLRVGRRLGRRSALELVQPARHRRLACRLGVPLCGRNGLLAPRCHRLLLPCEREHGLVLHLVARRLDRRLLGLRRSNQLGVLGSLLLQCCNLPPLLLCVEVCGSQRRAELDHLLHCAHLHLPCDAFELLLLVLLLVLLAKKRGARCRARLLLRPVARERVRPVEAIK